MPYQSIDRSAKLRGNEIPKGRRKWIFVSMICGIALVASAVSMIIAGRKSESPEFRAKIEAQLSSRLQADVSIAPLESRGLVFLTSPSVWVASRSGKWAVHLDNLSLEIGLSSIFRPNWQIRSSQVHRMEVWLGSFPEKVRTKASASEFWSPNLPDEESASSLGIGSFSMPRIRAATIQVQGPSYGEQPPSFTVNSHASGRLEGGELRWKLRGGELQLGADLPWQLDELAVGLNADGWILESGRVFRDDGAEVTIRPDPSSSQGRELVAEVEAKNIKLGLQSGVKNTSNPVQQVAIDAKGKFTARFPDLHRFRFLGGFQLTGLEMSEWRMFRLIASQTGDDRLKMLSSDWANGEIEWTPGLVRLNQIVFEEADIVRMQGRVSIVGSELAGVVDLALPAPVVGRFPGGKPSGFSYPASGWSWAQIRLTGSLDDWKEDLTERLIKEIDPNVAVVSNTAATSYSEAWMRKELSPSQAELLEGLFQKMLEK